MGSYHSIGKSIEVNIEASDSEEYKAVEKAICKLNEKYMRPLFLSTDDIVEI